MARGGGRRLENSGRWTHSLVRSTFLPATSFFLASLRPGLVPQALAYRDRVTGVSLVADDLTGACDSALPFLAGGPVRVGLWPHLPTGELACAAVSTESRDADASVAYARSREAAAGLAGDLLYRKLD